MMKNSYLRWLPVVFWAAFFLQSPQYKAQEDNQLELRHIAGFKSIDLDVGLNRFGYQGQLGYTNFLSDRLLLRLSGAIEWGQIGLTTYQTNLLFAGLNHTIFKNHDKLFVNLGYGVLSGFEISANSYIISNHTTFDYGIYIEANTEYYIINNCAWLVEMRQLLDGGSDFGLFRYYLSTGLRFYI